MAIDPDKLQEVLKSAGAPFAPDSGVVADITYLITQQRDALARRVLDLEGAIEKALEVCEFEGWGSADLMLKAALLSGTEKTKNEEDEG